MSKDIWVHYIHDMIHAIERVILKTKDIEFVIFEDDEDLQDIVIRNFIVIGEAAVRVPKKIQDQNKDVPWRKIKGMRNFVIHDYKEIKYSLVLKTAKEDLPNLKNQLEQIIKNHR